MIDIVSSKFLQSSALVSQIEPSLKRDEIVFLARSNVGKSSLLNALTNNKSLAKVSSTPGKTRLINYFSVTFMDRETLEKINAKFVDLPGFGYAKVSKSLKDEWEENLTNFLIQRREIKLFIHLIDARHPHLEIDSFVESFLEEYMDENQYLLKVFTKIDKLNQKEINTLKKEFPDVLMVSSAKKRGLSRLNGVIFDILKEDEDASQTI